MRRGLLDMFPSSVRGCLCYTQQGKALRMILLVSMRELTHVISVANLHYVKKKGPSESFFAGSS